MSTNIDTSYMGINKYGDNKNCFDFLINFYLYYQNLQKLFLNKKDSESF